MNTSTDEKHIPADDKHYPPEEYIPDSPSHDTDYEKEEHERESQASDDIAPARKNDDDEEDEKHLERAETTASSIGPPYSAFSKRKKQFIVFIAMWAGMISPLSATIYFPALNVLSADLNVSSGLINLTLTTYMIFQGLAPMFFGGFSDYAGRRSAYILGFIIYIGACIGIALQNSFAALLVLRCIQSTGSSGTIALGSGVVADVSTSGERGKYMGWLSAGMLIGPAIGPVLGGILAQFLGWRAIFWFLVIFVGVLMVPLVLAFPETGRNIVGNGSIPPQSWNVSLLSYLASRKAEKQQQTTHKLTRQQSRQSIESQRSALAKKRKTFRFPNPLTSMRICLEKDMGLLLLFNSLVYTAFYDVNASTPYLFAQIYGFNDLQIGLSFIPYGVGCFIAPIINGRLTDWNYRRVAKKYGFPTDKKRMADPTFPLEEARVPIAMPETLIGNAALLAYGWAIDQNCPLAVALVLQFIIGFCLTGAFGINQVMLVDNYPDTPASAVAANNLVRCLMGAGGTAVIIYMIDSMGRGWCFTFIAAVVFFTSSLLWVLLKWGPKWRAERIARDAAKKEAKKARKAKADAEE